jgi:putative membrane protein insertion efficiency factor
VIAAILKGVVRAYQVTLSPIFGGSCRFDPSCSHYAIEAIDRHGAWRGTRLAGARLLRCHPFGSAGYDPVPDVEKGGGRGVR